LTNIKNKLQIPGIIAAIFGLLMYAQPLLANQLTGQVMGDDEQPIVGALVTLRRTGQPLEQNIRETTVLSDESGLFSIDGLQDYETMHVRIRRIGWKDINLEQSWPDDNQLSVTMARETDPQLLAEQLPANRWFKLLYDKIEDPVLREDFVRNCMFCHQQGSAYTRIVRGEQNWNKILNLMARLGGIIRPELREILPHLIDEAYDPKTAIPALTANMASPDFAPPAEPAARRAVIDEWELGKGESMQHDIAVHPDGRVYSVDFTQDRLYSIDPYSETGDPITYQLPRPDNSNLGGLLGADNAVLLPGFNAYLAPHSLQMDSKGKIWMTLSYAGKMTSFDPKTGNWELFDADDGAIYPHTLRIDKKDRVWYTVAVSNHIGMLDPATGEHRLLDIPTTSIKQAALVKMIPVLMSVGNALGAIPEGGDSENSAMPTPYGIDVHPMDGSIWFSQLAENRIGRIDPETLEFEMIDTPFPGPRRMRFDSKGILWIPSFSGNRIASFDPQSRAFDEFELPIEPAGTEAPYTIAINPLNDDVWISATNSDSVIRFQPTAAPGDRYTVYPLPTRVTYTREIDFDKEGRAYTSNSNAPTWQIEGQSGRIIRIDPRDNSAPTITGLTTPATSLVNSEQQ
jgi:streptogramin lyase